jgi:hypothetical protein
MPVIVEDPAIPRKNMPQLSLLFETVFVFSDPKFTKSLPAEKLGDIPDNKMCL